MQGLALLPHMQGFLFMELNNIMSDFVNLAEVVKDNIASSNLAVGGSLTVGGGSLSSRRLWLL